MPAVLQCLLLLGRLSTAAADSADAAVLTQLKSNFTNGDSVLSSWAPGTDPCAGGWLGVACRGSGGVARVTEV